MSYRQLHEWILLPLVICAIGAHVESRKGAGPGPTGSRWFPFPAHRTGRAHFEHPALRQISPQAHGSRPRCTSRSRNTPNFPNTIASEKLELPRECTTYSGKRSRNAAPGVSGSGVWTDGCRVLTSQFCRSARPQRSWTSRSSPHPCCPRC